mmetsp:Transcript_33762/g.85456  ORF Transcript_33762/g.85456 Transcript_33762/m.85456 type:complete len:296 (-) Transcript_33762:3307-4194(-)
MSCSASFLSTAELRALSAGAAACTTRGTSTPTTAVAPASPRRTDASVAPAISSLMHSATTAVSESLRSPPLLLALAAPSFFPCPDMSACISAAAEGPMAASSCCAHAALCAGGFSAAPSCSSARTASAARARAGTLPGLSRSNSHARVISTWRRARVAAMPTAKSSPVAAPCFVAHCFATGPDARVSKCVPHALSTVTYAELRTSADSAPAPCDSSRADTDALRPSAASSTDATAALASATPAVACWPAGEKGDVGLGGRLGEDLLPPADPPLLLAAAWLLRRSAAAAVPARHAS